MVWDDDSVDDRDSAAAQQVALNPFFDITGEENAVATSFDHQNAGRVVAAADERRGRLNEVKLDTVKAKAHADTTDSPCRLKTAQRLTDD